MTYQRDVPPSLAERWILRRFRICGFVGGVYETIDAAVRAGVGDDLDAAMAFCSLTERSWVVYLDGVYVLTDAGRRAAERASETAARLGDPPVPVPQDFVPKIGWYDDADGGPSILDAQTDGRQAEEARQAQRSSMDDTGDSNNRTTPDVDHQKTIGRYRQNILARLQADEEGFYDLSDFRSWCRVAADDRVGVGSMLKAVEALVEEGELRRDTGSMYKRILLRRDEAVLQKAEPAGTEDADAATQDTPADADSDPESNDATADASASDAASVDVPTDVHADEHREAEPLPAVAAAPDLAPASSRPSGSKKKRGAVQKRKPADTLKKKPPSKAKQDTSPDFFEKLAETLRAQRDALKAQLKTTGPERRALAAAVRAAQRQLATFDARRADARLIIKRFERGMEDLRGLVGSLKLRTR